MKRFTVVFLILVLFFSLSFSQTAEEIIDWSITQKPTVLLQDSKFEINEVDPNAETYSFSPRSTEAFGDLIAAWEIESLTGETGNLAVEFAAGYLWVTARGLVNPNGNSIWKFDVSSGTPVYVADFPQGNTDAWGWRDMAYDGTFLYAGVGPNTIYQFDPVTGSTTGVTITGPDNPNRALAYDQATDHFWTKNFAGTLYEFDRNGTIVNQFSSALSSYGAGWDSFSPGGPYLWLNHSPGNTLTQLDPATATPTGTSLVAGGGSPGGLDIDVDIFPGVIAAVVLVQGTPFDSVYVYDLGPYGDPTDPLPPTGFTAFSDVVTPTDMLLTWTDPTNYVNGDTLINFEIIIARDGVTIDSVVNGVETFTDMGLTQYTEYTYDIWAKDTADSTSPMVSATWMASGYPPIMVVDPTSILDTLLAGGTSTHVLTITNNQGNPGPLDYTISENPAVGWLSVPSTSGTVAPASFVELDVDINSSGLTAGPYTTELIVAGNDPFNAADTVTVSLQVNEAPVVGFSPDSMDFTLDPTGVAYPATDSLIMNITNTGDGPLTFELTDEDVFGEHVRSGVVDRSYIRPEFNVEIAKGQPDWRHGTPQTEGAGGPDLFGYTWIDSDEPGGPTPNYIDISGTGTVLTWDVGTADDGRSVITLPFLIKFYGVEFNELTLCSNGWLGFDSYTSNYLTNAVIPSTSLPNNIVAILWDDLNGNENPGSNVYYQQIGNKFIIQFHDWARYSTTESEHLNFQYVFYQNSETIELQYATMDFGTGTYVDDHTIGIENGDGMDGLNVVFNANYIHDNMAILFSTESSWLSQNPSSGTIPPGGNADIWVKANSTGLIGGEYTALVHIMSNDPVHPDTTMSVGLTVFGTPEISVDPLILTFDTLLVGASRTLPVAVSNTGSFPLNVTNITTDNTDFTVDTTSFSVDVGQTQAVNVTFNPQTAQTYANLMNIFSDDPVTPIVIVTLGGTGLEAPVVAVAPDSFHFDLLSGESDSLQFTISNTGNGPLTFELTDEDVFGEHVRSGVVDRSYIRPEFNVEITKGQPDWRVGNPQTEGAGGPDLFGYKWIDSDEPGGPAFNWIDISSTGTPVVGLGDDAFVGPFPLGFTFSYYGTDYTEFYICSNGFLGFGPNTTGYTSLSNAQIPTAATPNNILPWMWDDLNPTTGGFIYYETVGNQLIVQFVDYPEYGSSGTVTAEVIINSNGSILYQYLEFLNGIDIANSTVGIENVDGTDGLEVVFNDPTYLHDDLAVVFSRESQWLSENPTSGTIPPGGSADIWAIANSTGLLGGDYLATVIVNNNDPVNPEVRLPKVSMHVTGVPRISVSPNSLVFDTVFVGEEPELQLTVENIGTDQLDVTSITSSDPVFTLDTTSLSLVPFSTYPVTVTFVPTLTGDYTAEIVFVTNDPVTPNDTVTVEAVAIEAPVITITPNFQNPIQVAPNDSADVYITIANSGGNDLTWSASISNAPVTRERTVPPVYSPFDISEYAEISPSQSEPPSSYSIEAPWDLQFSFDLETVTGALGNAGAEFDGMHYYTTRWASTLVHKIDLAGSLVEEFSIAGVSGLRDLAFDGTFMYGGAAANTIYIMDFVTQTLVGTIPSPVAVRFIAYDESADGFWVGNWDTPPTLIDRSGTTMATLTSGLTGQYGAAWDGWSDGGPYLWMFDQAADGMIHQYDLTNSTATGFTYDVAADFPASAGTAGGLWIGEGVVSGKVSIGGCLQGTPDVFFVYELAEAGATWLQLIGTTSGSIDPGDSYELQARVYGSGDPPDSAYVVIQSNDPNIPIVNELVSRQVITGIGDQLSLPTAYGIAQNYPNPFNPTTTIKYQLPQVSDVKLVIYNVLGQKVRTLVNNRIEAGYHSVVWDGLNQQGSAVASGIYIYRFEAGDFQKTMKLMLLK